MKSLPSTTVFIFIMMTLSLVSPELFAQKKDQKLDTLKQQITELLSKQKGNFAVAFKDLSTGKELLINEKMIFHAASTMKTPVMIEAFRQVKKKKFGLQDSIVLKNEFHS